MSGVKGIINGSGIFAASPGDLLRASDKHMQIWITQLNSFKIESIDQAYEKLNTLQQQLSMAMAMSAAKDNGKNDVLYRLTSLIGPLLYKAKALLKITPKENGDFYKYVEGMIKEINDTQSKYPAGLLAPFRKLLSSTATESETAIIVWETLKFPNIHSILGINDEATTKQNLIALLESIPLEALDYLYDEDKFILRFLMRQHKYEKEASILLHLQYARDSLISLKDIAFAIPAGSDKELNKLFINLLAETSAGTGSIAHPPQASLSFSPPVRTNTTTTPLSQFKFKRHPMELTIEDLDVFVRAAILKKNTDLACKFLELDTKIINIVLGTCLMYDHAAPVFQALLSALIGDRNMENQDYATAIRTSIATILKFSHKTEDAYDNRIPLNVAEELYKFGLTDISGLDFYLRQIERSADEIDNGRYKVKACELVFNVIMGFWDAIVPQDYAAIQDNSEELKTEFGKIYAQTDAIQVLRKSTLLHEHLQWLYQTNLGLLKTKLQPGGVDVEKLLKNLENLHDNLKPKL